MTKKTVLNKTKLLVGVKLMTDTESSGYTKVKYVIHKMQLRTDLVRMITSLGKFITVVVQLLLLLFHFST